MGTESVEPDRDALIEKNLPLVGYQVAELLRRVPSFVQREDLASAGSLALVQAANSYNPETGVPFHRFAIYRIRGAMLDELRAMDWATRGARNRAKRLEETTAALTAAQGRAPTREELAEALGIEVEQVESAQLDASRRVVSIDVTYNEDDNRTMEIIDEGLTPEDSVLSDERLVYLKAAVKALPQRLRYVVEQVFFEERTVNEVAESLGVTQSRVSQLRTEALAMIRDGMEHHLAAEDLPEAPHEEPKRKTGVVEKRRQSYLQKIADNAETIMETEKLADSPVETRARETKASKTLRTSVAGKSKVGERPKNLETIQGELSSLRLTTSTTGFLAGRSKSSAQARAQLRAEAEARAAEAEKRKSKDKVREKKHGKTSGTEAEAIPKSHPPTASYLGELSMRRYSKGSK